MKCCVCSSTIKGFHQQRSAVNNDYCCHRCHRYLLVAKRLLDRMWGKAEAV